MPILSRDDYTCMFVCYLVATAIQIERRGLACCGDLCLCDPQLRDKRNELLVCVDQHEVGENSPAAQRAEGEKAQLSTLTFISLSFFSSSLLLLFKWSVSLCLTFQRMLNSGFIL